MRKLWENAEGHHSDRSVTPSVSANILNTTVSPFLTTPAMYDAGTDPRSVAVGDFNADGKQDIIVAADPPMLLLGNGDGTFQPGTPIGTGSNGTVAVADFNHDGALDLVFAGGGSVEICLGNGNGTFSAGMTFSSGGTNLLVSSQVLVADANNDGVPDLIVNTDTGISVLLGNGNGSFQAAKVTSASAHFMAVADFNRDGRLDVAVTNGSSSLAILLGSGDGTFVSNATYVTSPAQGLTAIAAADFNQDGLPDVALANGQIFIGNGHGFLSLSGTFEVSPSATTLSAVDVNGDGILDLVTAEPGIECGLRDFGTAGVSLGNGDGTFQSVRIFDAGGCDFRAPFVTSLAFGDLNGDGAPDLVEVGGQQSIFVNSAELSILINRGSGNFSAAESSIGGGTGSVAVDDFNRDGNPDLAMADGSVYLGGGDGSLKFVASASLGAVALGTGDFNHDGRPDIASAVECAPSGCANGGQLLISLGNGDGTFGRAMRMPSKGFYAESLAIGDLNGDGSPDIAVLNNCTDANCSVVGGSISIFFGNLHGTFRFGSTMSLNEPISRQGTPVSLIVGDFNNDGVLDLAAVAPLPGTFEPSIVEVMLGKGDGSFQAPVVFTTSTQGAAFSAMAADFNGDGRLDLALADGDTCADCNAHGAILYGNGDGTFVEGPQIATAGGPPVSVAAADFYGNGTLTPVLANECRDALDCPGGSMMIDGTDNITDIMLEFLAVGDFNNDGKPDVVGSLQYDAGASVLLDVAATVAATTMTISPSAAQSYAASQPVTLTALVHHTGPGKPTGTVNFLDNGISIGSAAVDINGQASLTATTLAIGPHFIVPHYVGDSNFAPSNALGVRVTIDQATSTGLTSNANPSYPSQTVTLTANITSQSGGVLSGSVVFKQGRTVVATVPLSNGQAEFTTTYTTTGIRQITATYSGDTSDLGSTSAVLRQSINKLPAVTTTRVSTSGSASNIGQPVTFTALVMSSFGPIPDGEIVTFYNGATAMGTGMTASGVATFTTSSLTAKTHIIKATYPGDGTFKTSFGTVQQVVDLYSSTTLLTSTPNPSTTGQIVTLTATVQSSNPNTPSGTVTFKNGTQNLGSAKLSGAMAALKTSRLPAGTDSITAVYGGDTGTGKSTSAGVTQRVN